MTIPSAYTRFQNNLISYLIDQMESVKEIPIDGHGDKEKGIYLDHLNQLVKKFGEKREPTRAEEMECYKLLGMRRDYVVSLLSINVGGPLVQDVAALAMQYLGDDLQEKKKAIVQRAPQMPHWSQRERMSADQRLIWEAQMADEREVFPLLVEGKADREIRGVMLHLLAANMDKPPREETRS